LTNKGTQNPYDIRVTKFLKGLSPEQNKTFDNSIRRKVTSPEFADFLKEKLGFESIEDLNQFGNMENFDDEELTAYLSEFLEARFEFDIDEVDYDQTENSNRIFVEKLLAYLSELTKVNIDKIYNLSKEEIYTLKQFLKDKYLSATDVEMLLKETDFKAAYSNVNEKINRLHDLDFVKDIHPTGGGYISKFDGRSQYYKLTSCGLFCVLKEIQEEDMGDPIMESNIGIKIFEVYQDDPLLQLFIHDLIDKNLLPEITDFHIKRMFVNYLKQVCQELYKQLSGFVNFQKNGIRVGLGVKWNRNLVDKKAEWNRFFDNLLGNVILVPTIDNKISNMSELVVNPHISECSCSFCYDNRKFSIDIDTQNKSAKLCINDKEYFKVYDPEKGVEVYGKYGEIAVQIKPHCFILNRVSRESYDYLHSLMRRFFIPIKLLKTQLGFSILQLFEENDFVKYGLSSTASTKMYYSELIKLATDEKVIQLIEDFHNEVNKNYNEFTKYSK